MCVCVCAWICYRDNSKLRASIFTKLGLYSVGEGSDHLQLIKFWPSRAPARVCGEVNFFWIRLTTASVQCLRLSERYFINFVVVARQKWKQLRCASKL